MKNRKAVFWIPFAVCGFLHGQALDQYLEIAAENNPALNAKFHEYMAAVKTVPQVGVLSDPQIAFGHFIRPIETRLGPQEYRISLTQMFPWFGTLGAKKERAAQMAQAKFAAFEDAKFKLFFDVKSAYYEIYFIRQSVRITRDNIQILKTFQDLALVRVESGSASSVDALRAEMALADLKIKLANLEDRRQDRIVRFNLMLNRDARAVVEIPDSLASPDFRDTAEAALSEILTNHRSLARLDHLLASSQAGETLAKKSGLPGLALGVEYIGIGASDNPMVDEDGRDALVFPKIGISLPLYRKKYAAMAQEARHRTLALDAQKTEQTNLLETLFEKTYSDYQDADRRLALYRAQTERAGQAMQILETDYATAGVNFEEILRMEERLLRYALERERARRDKQAAIAFMTYLMGQ